METINLKNSFLAVIQYHKAEQKLFLTMKAGKQFSYENCTPERWEKIQNANNKGSYIANNIINGDNCLIGKFVRLLTPAEINRVQGLNKFYAI